MEINGKVHCFFEQSGTFKNEFIKLGIPAEDYDIQNNFGETDHTDDLFKAIENAYDGKPSLFDSICPDDLILAFFPCIRFCNIAEYNQRSAREKWKRDGMPVDEIYRKLKKAADERHEFYILALKMHAVVEIRGLRMIMENPWATTNYTNYFWFMKPSVIDYNRRLRGDYFQKPTAYWFTNCEPTSGCTLQPCSKRLEKTTGISSWRKKPVPKKYDKNKIAKGSKKTGLCSEERSMISPDYARNFICDFILGKDQKINQLSLFNQ